MIQLRSIVKVADNSGAKMVKIIKVLGHSKMRYGRVGDVIVAAVIDAETDGGAKMHQVVKGVVIRTRHVTKRADGSSISFDDNAVVLINKDETDVRATRVFGPVAREVKLRFPKIISLAPEVL